MQSLLFANFAILQDFAPNASASAEGDFPAFGRSLFCREALKVLLLPDIEKSYFFYILQLFTTRNNVCFCLIYVSKPFLHQQLVVSSIYLIFVSPVTVHPLF